MRVKPESSSLGEQAGELPVWVTQDQLRTVGLLRFESAGIKAKNTNTILNKHTFSSDRFICFSFRSHSQLSSASVNLNNLSRGESFNQSVSGSRSREKVETQRSPKLTTSIKMNFFVTFATIALGLIACLLSLAQAGGDKSAKTTVSI